MRAFLLIASLVLSVLGQGDVDSDFHECTYQTYDANGVVYFYDVSELYLESGETSYGIDDIEHAKFWIFNLCGNLDGLSSYFEIPFACTSGSAACFRNSLDKSSNWTSAGISSDYTLGDSIYGVGQGVSLTYFNGDECSSASEGIAYRQVRFELVCDVNATEISAFGNTIISDSCYDTIIINTSAACPGISQSTFSGETTEGVRYRYKFTFHMWMVGPLTAFALMCCVCFSRCCCNRRTRRCSKQSKAGYAPVPQSIPVDQPEVVSQMPAPNMIQLQNYSLPQFYFYPQVPVQQAPVQQGDQLTKDEELAKQLQAQFDKEVSN